MPILGLSMFLALLRTKAASGTYNRSVTKINTIVSVRIMNSSAGLLFGPPTLGSVTAVELLPSV